MRYVKSCLAIAALAAGLLVVGAAPAQAAPVKRVVPDQFSTIQAAIDASSAGDTVLVRSGTYNESIDFHGKNISVVSKSGAAATTIDAVQSTTVTIGPNGRLQGFTVAGGTASFGAGLNAIGVGSLIQQNVFTGNTEGGGGFGAAIGGNSASPVITRNWFTNNSCDSQFLSGVVAFVNGSSPQIHDNVFVNNPCRAINMVLPEGNQPFVSNNTIVGNTEGIRVGAQVPTASQVYQDNIITGNGVGIDIDSGSPARNPTLRNNLVFGNTTDYQGISNQTGVNGNISADPQFTNPAHQNFNLKTTSPAIDAGTNAGVPAVDYAGHSRVVDGNNDTVATVDIGAYELQTRHH